MRASQVLDSKSQLRRLQTIYSLLWSFLLLLWYCLSMRVIFTSHNNHNSDPIKTCMSAALIAKQSGCSNAVNCCVLTSKLLTYFWSLGVSFMCTVKISRKESFCGLFWGRALEYIFLLDDPDEGCEEAQVQLYFQHNCIEKM